MPSREKQGFEYAGGVLRAHCPSFLALRGFAPNPKLNTAAHVCWAARQGGVLVAPRGPGRRAEAQGDLYTHIYIYAYTSYMYVYIYIYIYTHTYIHYIHIYARTHHHPHPHVVNIRRIVMIRNIVIIVILVIIVIISIIVVIVISNKRHLLNTLLSIFVVL